MSITIGRLARMGLLMLAGVIVFSACMAGPLGSTPAFAASLGPHWEITSAPLPTYFKQGDPADKYTLIAMNDGGQATNGSTATVADTLPPGLTATGIEGYDLELSQSLNCVLSTLSCTFSGEVVPNDLLIVTITVSVASELPPTVTNLATASGGGAPNATVSDPTTISSSPVPFGLSYLATHITDGSGLPETQVGAHPFQMTTSLAFNSGSLEAEGFPLLNAEAKDIEVALPPGLVGDPGAVPQCSQITFETVRNGGNCPADTQVGLLQVFFYSHGHSEQTAPIYNLVPPQGQPAELGFTVDFDVHIPIFFHVRNDGDYGLTAQLTTLSEADPVRASILTLWGVPADPSHDSVRRAEPSCPSGCGSDAPLKPFMTLPSSCESEPPPGMSMTTDSWQNPGLRTEESLPDLADPNWTTLGTELPPFTGCARLSFSPTLSAQPAATQAGAPSGYTIELGVPQNDSPTGLATSTLRDATIALPLGTTLSPGAADGLQACTDAQFALRSQNAASCPQASQIGTVLVHSPLLRAPLVGQLYVGQPTCAVCSPADAQSGRLVRLFLQAQGLGVTVKLAGNGSIDQGTGALSATFENNPQLPFDSLQVTLNGGPRAPLANPRSCGPVRSTAQLTPWSSPFTPDATPESGFEVTGCPPAQFGPGVAVGTLDNQAGAFGALTFTLTRGDSEQDLGQLSLRTPAGLLGLLAKVTPCAEPLAASGECPEASQIGHVIAAVGSGSNPLYVPQAGRAPDPVYLTGPYHGAPFGLTVVVHGEAGPFNLGPVVVRSAINVDPHTSQVTVTSDPLPASKDGVPLHIRTLNVTLDRAGFMFNPTTANRSASPVRSPPRKAWAPRCRAATRRRTAPCWASTPTSRRGPKAPLPRRATEPRCTSA